MWPHCLVPKQTLYSFYWLRRDERCNEPSLVQCWALNINSDILTIKLLSFNQHQPEHCDLLHNILSIKLRYAKYFQLLETIRRFKIFNQWPNIRYTKKINITQIMLLIQLIKTRVVKTHYLVEIPEVVVIKIQFSGAALLFSEIRKWSVNKN